MPHVSKKELSIKTKAKLERHLFTLLMETSTDKRQRIFGELFTPTERVMFAKRIGMLILINRGMSTYTISKSLSLSSSTVLRFENAVEKGWYKETGRQLNRPVVRNAFIKFLLDVGAVPFGPRPKPLIKLLENL